MKPHLDDHLADLPRGVAPLNGADRRWLLGARLLLLYRLGFALINDNLHQPLPERDPASLQAYNFLLMAGLYVVHFLTVMLAIFASVDTVSGEIASHTIQTIVTKPVRRWQILLGKWLGYAAMLLLYLGLLGGGILLVTYLVVGYHAAQPAGRPRPADARSAGAALALAARRHAPLDADQRRAAVHALRRGLIGTWVEQIGALLQSHAAVRIGIVTSLLMPVEALWRRAAYLMQGGALNLNSFVSPFAAFSVPNADVIFYAWPTAPPPSCSPSSPSPRRDL